MIEVQGLTKRYGSKVAVDDVSFTVDKGEILGFLGPNGAGKSTTMNILTGYLSSNIGTVKIGEFDILDDPDEAKRKIGYLPENAPLPPNMTVRAFLKYVAAMRGISFFKRKQAVLDAVRDCALEDVLDQEIESLSKGYKRRVCFAQAIIHKPQVLLLDEPTDGLDPNQKREIRNLIQTLSKNTAIIISTHILEEVRSVCTKVLLLAGGKIAFQGSTGDFTALEDQLKCAAFSFPPEQLQTAAEILQNTFPGSCRLDGERIILPADLALIPALAQSLEQAGITEWNSVDCAASLDDVFAYLTRQQKEVKTQSAAETPAPAEPQEGENDDD